MPKVIKKKSKKKDSVSEVEVKDRLSEMRQQLQSNRKIALTVGSVILAVIFLVAGIYYYRSSVERSAQILEAEAYNALYNDSGQEALPEKERLAKALDLFRKAYDKKPLPKTLLFIATVHYQLGAWDEALQSLDELLQKFPQEADLGALALQKKVEILILKNDRASALSALEKISGSSSDALKDYALFTSASLLEQDGKGDEASKKYKELVDSYPASPYAELAKPKVEVEKTEEAVPAEK